MLSACVDGAFSEAELPRETCEILANNCIPFTHSFVVKFICSVPIDATARAQLRSIVPPALHAKLQLAQQQQQQSRAADRVDGAEIDSAPAVGSRLNIHSSLSSFADEHEQDDAHAQVTPGPSVVRHQFF